MRLKINIDKEITSGEDVLAAIIEFHNEVTGVLLENKGSSIDGMSPQKYVATMMYISLHLCSLFTDSANKLQFKQFVLSIADSYLQTKDIIDKAVNNSRLYN